MPGPTPSYLVQYNGYQLPGYAQAESFDSSMNVVNHQAPYADGSLSEQTGLENKSAQLTMKVWEENYLTCKEQVAKAATMLRSKRAGFAPLYVQYTDRYYEAMVKKIQEDKSVPASVRTLEYVIDLECKPWLTSVSGHTISGTTTVTTTGRTIDDGGWTPTVITVTGTNVTISGYTSTGDFTGFISISGAVTGMIIDSSTFESTIGGNNANDRMYWADYQMFVGPGVTSFDVTGASSCSITYYDRWYL